MRFLGKQITQTHSVGGKDSFARRFSQRSATSSHRESDSLGLLCCTVAGNPSDECVGLCGTAGGRRGGRERAVCCAINPNYISKQINPIRCCGGGSAPTNQSTLRIIHAREGGGFRGVERMGGWGGEGGFLSSVETLPLTPPSARAQFCSALPPSSAGRPAIIHAGA